MAAVKLLDPIVIYVNFVLDSGACIDATEKWFLYYCKAQPHHALLSYPFCNTAAHMEATPTRDGI